MLQYLPKTEDKCIFLGNAASDPFVDLIEMQLKLWDILQQANHYENPKHIASNHQQQN